MNANQKKAIALIVLLVAAIAGGTLLYNQLAGGMQMVTLLSDGAGTGTTALPADTATLEATVAPAATAAPGATSAPEVTSAPEATEAPEVTAQPEAAEQAQAEVAGPQPRANLAPVFTVYDAEGNAVRLSDMRGKPTLVNFFASWCGPCKMEMPYFDACWQEYGDRIHFMMIDMCGYGNDTQAAAQRMIDEAGYAFPVYFDTDGDAMMTYRVTAFPTTAVFSADGELLAQHVGVVSEEVLRETLNGLLEE